MHLVFIGDPLARSDVSFCVCFRGPRPRKLRSESVTQEQRVLRVKVANVRAVDVTIWMGEINPRSCDYYFK